MMEKQSAACPPMGPPYGWQQEVGDWVTSRFGSASLFDRAERMGQIVEETCELARAAKMRRRKLHAISRHVYRQPPGELRQESAGLVVTLFEFAEAHGFDLMAETRKEIDRILSVPVEVSRHKQALKAQAGIARAPGTLEPR